MVFSMRKKIIVIIIILLVIIGIFYKFNDLLVPLIFRNEQVGMYEINKMQECKNSEERIITLKSDDFQVILPLPYGAVEFKNEIYPTDNQYLISTKYGELENYINNILPDNGFSTERLGAMVYIKDSKNDINITMSIDMFTANFMRLNYFN